MSGQHHRDIGSTLIREFKRVHGRRGLPSEWEAFCQAHGGTALAAIAHLRTLPAAGPELAPTMGDLAGGLEPTLARPSSGREGGL